MRRVVLFLLTNFAILFVLSISARIFDYRSIFDRPWAEYGHAAYILPWIVQRIR